MASRSSRRMFVDPWLTRMRQLWDDDGERAPVEAEPTSDELAGMYEDACDEIAQLRKDMAELEDDLRIVREDNARLRRVNGLKVTPQADRTAQLLGEIEALELQVAKLRTGGDPVTRDQWLRERETVARLEERLAAAEGRPHGKPFDRVRGRT